MEAEREALALLIQQVGFVYFRCTLAGYIDRFVFVMLVE
jgi:hypothetical protein